MNAPFYTTSLLACERVAVQIQRGAGVATMALSSFDVAGLGTFRVGEPVLFHPPRAVIGRLSP